MEASRRWKQEVYVSTTDDDSYFWKRYPTQIGVRDEKNIEQWTTVEPVSLKF